MSCKDYDLRVWHMPQIGVDVTFNVDVSTPEEAIKVLDILANYDLFQFQNKIKPDYSNASGLEMYIDGDWEEWYHPELDEDINGYERFLKEEATNG